MKKRQERQKRGKDIVTSNHVPTKKFPTRASVERAIDREMGRRAK